MPRSKLKLTPEQRGEALFLLDKGFTVNQAARALQEIRHPEHPLEVVRRAYFPPGGQAVIHTLQGKSHEKIARRYFWIVKDFNRRTEMMRKHNKLPRSANWRSKVREGVRRYWQSEESRTRASEASRRRWGNPAYRDKMVKILSKIRQKGKELAVKKLKERWQHDAAYRARQLENLSKSWKDPEFRARQAQRAREFNLERWQRPGEREAQSKRARATMLKLLKQPGFIEKQIETRMRRLKDPAVRAAYAQRARNVMLRLRSDPEFLRKSQGGLARFREEHRRQRVLAARAASGTMEEQPGGWEGEFDAKPRKRVPVQVPTIEETIHIWRGLDKTLSELSPLQRFIVAHTFGIETEHKPEIVEQAKHLSKEQWQNELDAAYAYITKNRRIKKLFE